jgi:lipopolysaccharide heptosyltransferase II
MPQPALTPRTSDLPPLDGAAPDFRLTAPPARILVTLLLPIGDTLFATPAIHALRAAYPRAHITALVYPSNAGILVNNADVDDLWRYPTRGHPILGRALHLAFDLRRAGFDLSAEFSNYNAWLARWARVPVRTHQHLPVLWWIDAQAGKPLRRKHAVEVYGAVVRRLGLPIPDWRLRMRPTEADAARAAALLARHGIQFGEPVIGIHPGGEGLWGRKRWSPAKFAAVADGLHEAAGGKIVVLGGREEAHIAADVARRAQAPVFNLAGQTSLGETAAMAAACSLFIGNDSSPLHIAAAVGTPVVGIYGPTSPYAYRPWLPGGQAGRDYAIVLGHRRCAGQFTLGGSKPLSAYLQAVLCDALETIQPPEVLAAARRLLAQHTPHPALV